MRPSGLAIEARGITKRYGPISALDEVSFDLRPGEVHALLGHNGAGKSTFVKVLAGIVQPDSGELLVDGAVASFRNPRDAQAQKIAVVDQELSLVPTLTVGENIDLGNIAAGLGRGRRRRERLERLLARLGLEDVGIDTPVEELAIGERQLVEIARGLSRDAKVLILDEPTATLSESEIERVFRAVREIVAEGRSVIFVSHRLGEVLALCDRVTVLRDGRRLASRDVGDLDRAGIVRLMLGEAAEIEVLRAPKTLGAPNQVRITGLSVPDRVRGFDLDAARGEVVGIAGQVGSGASEVLRALAGLIPEARGSVVVGDAHMRLGAPHRSQRAGVVFASNNRKGEGLFLDQSIAQNLVATRLGSVTRAGILDRGAISALAERLADLIGVDRKRLDLPVGYLSGGNQQKVFLGRSLEQRDARLLLLDEPTRGVDVGGRADIHRLILHAAAEGNTVIFASTELDEILDLADTVVTMFAGRVVSIASREQSTAADVLADMTHRDASGAAL